MSQVASRLPSTLGLKGLLASALFAAAFISVTAEASNTDNATRLLRAGKHGEALKVLEAGLKADANDPQLRFTKGLVLMEQKRRRQSPFFSSLVRITPICPSPTIILPCFTVRTTSFRKPAPRSTWQ